MSYAAFISYSHAGDARLAEELHRALASFAKPVFALRALRIFRDKSGLAVTPSLWAAIKRALDESQYLVFLACPESAASAWARKEVEYWLETKSADRILIVLTSGALSWDEPRRTFDAAASTAIPPRLRDCFGEEPLYVDMRWARASRELGLRHATFVDAVAQLAARLHGRPKDELIGDDLRARRRLRLLGASAITSLVALTVLAILSTIWAVEERDNALSRLLAGEALAVAAIKPNNVEKGLLLAVAASLMQPTLESNQALRFLAAQLPRPVYAAADESNVAADDVTEDARLAATLYLDGRLTVTDVADGRRLWDRQLDAPTPLDAHAWAVAFSPDGAWVVVHGAGDRLTLFETASGAERPGGVAAAYAVGPDGRHMAVARQEGLLLEPLRGDGRTRSLFDLPMDYVALRFSPNGRYFAALQANGALRIWRTRDWRAAAELRGASRADTVELKPDVVAFSADGSRVAFGTKDGLTVWSMEAQEEVAVLPLDGYATAAAFHPRRDLVAAAGSDGGVATVHDLPSGERVFRVSHDTRILSLEFSADGHLLASASGDHSARVWQTSSGRELARVGHASTVGRARFVDSGRKLATYGTATPLKLWDLRAPRLLGAFPGWRYTRAVAFHPAEAFVVAGGSTGVAVAEGLGALDPERRVFEHSRSCATPGFEPAVLPVFSGSGARLASACGAEIIVWDWRSGAPLARWDAGQPVHCMAFDPAGRRLAAGGNMGWVGVWDLERERDVEQIPVRRACWDVAFHPGGDALAIAEGNLLGKDGAVRLWDLSEGAQASLLERDAVVYKVSFSPNGSHLAAAGGDGSVLVLDGSSGAEVHRFHHRSSVFDVAFHPGGELVASASADGAVTLWNVLTGDKETVFAHEGPVMALAFSPGAGRYLATAGHDHQGHVWDVRTGAELAREAYPGAASAVAFSADGRYVAVAGDRAFSGGLWLWRNDELVAEACRRVASQLDESHLRKYAQLAPYRATCEVARSSRAPLAAWLPRWLGRLLREDTPSQLRSGQTVTQAHFIQFLEGYSLPTDEVRKTLEDQDLYRRGG